MMNPVSERIAVVLIALATISQVSGQQEIEVPPPMIETEPTVTAGITNILRYTLPDCKQYLPPGTQVDSAAITVFIVDSNNNEDKQTTRIDSIICSTDTRAVLVDSLGDQPLRDGIEYSYYLKLTVDVGGGRFQSPASETVHSIQDATAPVGEILGLADSTNRETVQINFSLDDAVSKGVDRALLWYRIAPDTAWNEPPQSLPLPGISPVMDMFNFSFEPRNGWYEFFVGGIDAAWAPDNSGKMGNRSVPTAPLDSILYDTIPPDTVTLSCSQVADSIRLCWTEATDPRPGVGVMEYRIFRGDGDSLATVPAEQNCFTDTTFDRTQEATLVYQVQPVDSLLNVQRRGGTAECPFIPRPTITMKAEPGFTKSDSNVVCWMPSDPGLFASYVLFYAADGDTIMGDATSALCDTVNTLKEAIRYDFWVVGTDTFGREIPSLNIVSSTQDTTAPVVTRPESMTLPDCIASSSFDVPFEASDPASVDSATLYYRMDSDSDWVPFDSIRVEEIKPMVMDRIPFEVPDPPREGYFEFYVSAKDTARAADAFPSILRKGADGNQRRPTKNDTALYTLSVDTTKPWSRIVNLDSVQKSISFKVPYTASDTSENTTDVAGLDSVTLFYLKRDDRPERYESHALDRPSRVDSFFVFNVPPGADGRYFFYTKAYDACGNVQMDTLIVPVDAIPTPRILSIFPESGSFYRKSDVDSIQIVFDRIVKPETAWTEVIKVANMYSCSNREVSFSVKSDTASVDTLICWPDRIDSTGFYQIGIDSTSLIGVATDDNLTGAPLDWYTFNVYTYMEAGKGGSICAPGLQLVVPPDSLNANIVIMFSATEAGPCEYSGFNVTSNSATAIKAYSQPNVPASVDAGSTLCLSYAGLDTGPNPQGCRVFQQLLEGCLPAGDKNSWASDPNARVCARVDNLFGVFYIACPEEVRQRVLGNYPNPFGSSDKGTTKITYILNDANASVNLRIYDQFGNLVRNFDPANLTRHQGLNECPWDGKNDLGENVANGGYIAVLKVGSNIVDRRKIGVVR